MFKILRARLGPMVNAFFSAPQFGARRSVPPRAPAVAATFPGAVLGYREGDRMTPLLAISHHTGIRLAEVGFLLILIAGVWLAIAEAFDDKWRRFRIIVAGVLLAVAGLLLIIATHWGQFG